MFLIDDSIALVTLSGLARLFGRPSSQNGCLVVNLVTLINPIAVHIYSGAEVVDLAAVLSRADTALEGSNAAVTLSIRIIKG